MTFLRSALTLNCLKVRGTSLLHNLAIVIILLAGLFSADLAGLGTANAASSTDWNNARLNLKPGEYRPGQVVVKFRDSIGGKRVNNIGLHPESLMHEDILAPYHLESYDTFSNMPGFARYYVDPKADLAKAITAISLDPNVESVQPNYIRTGSLGTNDPLYNQTSNSSDPTAYRQWYLKQINIEPLWDVTTGNTQIVAVVDSGVNPYQEDLVGRVDLARSYNFVGGYAPGAIPNDGLPLAAPVITAGTIPGTVQSPSLDPTWDDQGHGTLVAGIIAAHPNNGVGIAGINWQSTILSVKVIDGNNEGDSITIARGILYAADNQARLINLSLGGSNESFIEAYAVKYALGKGTLIVAASGNGAELVRPSFPAGYEGVLAVGASDKSDKVAYFSNSANYLSVVAPGVDIFSSYCYFLDKSLRRTNTNVGDNNVPNRSDLYIAQYCPVPGQYKALVPIVGLYPDGTEKRGQIDPCDANDINSCYRNYNSDSMYITEDGTSFAAPIVTGIASLIVAARPDISNDQVRQLIESTAKDIGAPGRDNNSGYGRIDAGAIALALRTGVLSPNRNSFLQGIVTGANTNDVIVNLNPPDVNKQLDPSNGGFRYDGLGAGKYELRLAVPKRGIVLGPVDIYPNGQYGNVINVNFDVASGTIVCGAGSVCPGNQNSSPGQIDTPPPPPPSNLSPNSTAFSPAGQISGDAYFSQTSHNLGGSFRAYWESHGGLSIFGYPISEEFPEVSATDGKTYTVQYFERNRFEFHPENNDANKVLLGLLGSEMTKGRNFPPGAPVPNTSTTQYFPETGHSLTGRFLSYWKSNGGLAIFGYPISEPLQEGAYLVQYFERNRFELHPENVAPYDVLLGLLGTDLARSRKYLP